MKRNRTDRELAAAQLSRELRQQSTPYLARRRGVVDHDVINDYNAAEKVTLKVAGMTENVTVTAQSPVVETSASKIGTNITSSEIDNAPSANRSQFSLMQTIPGLVPALQVGSFEGGQFNANGQATTGNLFLVDGQYDNDSRRGGSQGTQARVTLDSGSV